MPTIKSYGRRFEVGVSAKLLMPGDDCGAFTVTGSPKQGPDGYDVPVRWHNNDREGTYSSYLGERFMVLRSREDLPVTPVYEATAQQTALDWNPRAPLLLASGQPARGVRADHRLPQRNAGPVMSATTTLALTDVEAKLLAAFEAAPLKFHSTDSLSHKVAQTITELADHVHSLNVKLIAAGRGTIVSDPHHPCRLAYIPARQGRAMDAIEQDAAAVRRAEAISNEIQRLAAEEIDPEDGTVKDAERYWDVRLELAERVAHLGRELAEITLSLFAPRAGANRT